MYEQAEVLSTGVPVLDELVGRATFVEFFGPWTSVQFLLNRFIVQHSGDVELLVTQEFGALDTVALRRIGKNLGVKPEATLSRVFSLQSTIQLLRDATRGKVSTLAVVDPYLYAPKTPEGYGDVTPITAALHQLGQGRPLAVFNRPSKFGHGLPEGGTYHHHTVPVLVEISTTRTTMSAMLVKHPWSPLRRVQCSMAEVYGERVSGPGKQTLLNDWVETGA